MKFLFQSEALRTQLDLYDDSGKISKEAYFEESNGRKAAEEQLEKVIRKERFQLSNRRALCVCTEFETGKIKS